MKKLLMTSAIMALLIIASACSNNTLTIVEDDNPPSSSANETSQNNTSNKNEEIQIGSTYTIPDLCTFSVNYVELTKEVEPPNPDGYYSYYAEEDGKTYVDISVTVENLRETKRTADEFGVALVICDDKYEYDSFSIIEEDNGTDFTYTNITNIDPLTVGKIHYLASIPNKVADDEEMSIELQLTMLENEYTLTIR